MCRSLSFVKEGTDNGQSETTTSSTSITRLPSTTSASTSGCDPLSFVTPSIVQLDPKLESPNEGTSQGGIRTPYKFAATIGDSPLCGLRTPNNSNGKLSLLCFICTRCFCGDVSCVIFFNVQDMVVVW